MLELGEEMTPFTQTLIGQGLTEEKITPISIIIKHLNSFIIKVMYTFFSKNNRKSKLKRHSF